jgi:hypothetical protein
MTPPTLNAEALFTLERSRTQALVERDMALAQRLHAPDYQLITPAGKSYAREAYLDDIATGKLQYVRWEAGEMNARLSPGMAVVRYAARLVFPSGNAVDCWHTDSYELRGPVWQAVWSQATAISPHNLLALTAQDANGAPKP